MTAVAEPPVADAPAAPTRRGRRTWLRRTVLAGLALVAVLVVYLLVTFSQVLLASQRDGARPAEAIVVFGAAQYDGRPSPVLAARLDHAYALWEAGYAPLIVVTGGNRPGDRFTEATASAGYLHEQGVPDDAIRREVQGRSSWESLAAAARFLDDEGIDDVILVTDPAHSYRVEQIAREVGLRAVVSPARGLERSTLTQLKELGRETVAVAVGRVIGFRRLLDLDHTVGEVTGEVRERAG